MITNNTIPCLHRKEWQTMNPSLSNSVAGAFVTTYAKERRDYAFYCLNATTHYLYSHNEDYWLQLPSGALAGTFVQGHVVLLTVGQTHIQQQVEVQLLSQQLQQ